MTFLLGAEPLGLSPDAAHVQIESELVALSELTAAMGIRPEIQNDPGRFCLTTP